MSEFVTVGNAAEIPSGQGKIFEVKGNQVAVWNVNGNYYAFQNVCPHRGGPVGEGELEGTVITCPWHGWSFDVTTCASPINPSAKLTRYDVKVEDNQIKIGV